MIKNYRCPKCQNLISKQEYYSHSKYCRVQTQPYTTKVDTKNNNSNNNTTSNYSNNYKKNNPLNSNTVYYINNNNNNNYNRNLTSKLNTNSKQRQPLSQVLYFRPQTTTYFNANPNKLYNYSQNQKNVYSINNSSGLTYKCNKCGKNIPLREQRDHLLSHKLEQEEKDRLQAQRLQEEDLFDNLSPEEIEEQRKIEENIKRAQRQNNNYGNNNYRNNNFRNNNNNFIDNDFDNDMNDMEMDINDSFGQINMSGFPNMIIGETNDSRINNINSRIGGSNFFENLFNGNLDNNFFNRPSSGNIRRIVIPMDGMGNIGGFGGDDDLNEMIERMLHHTRENPTDSAIVSELPETKIEDINKLDNDKKNCVICMEDFKNGDKSTNLPCLHMFHTNCIQNWLKTQNTCPICKYKLTQDNINNVSRRG